MQTVRKGSFVEISTAFTKSSKLKSLENLNQEPATHHKDSACSERALAYKIPVSLAQLARQLDRANML